jgi:hypothetical protein
MDLKIQGRMVLDLIKILGHSPYKTNIIRKVKISQGRGPRGFKFHGVEDIKWSQGLTRKKFLRVARVEGIKVGNPT